MIKEGFTIRFNDPEFIAQQARHRKEHFDRELAKLQGELRALLEAPRRKIERWECEDCGRPFPMTPMDYIREWRRLRKIRKQDIYWKEQQIERLKKEYDETKND